MEELSELQLKELKETLDTLRHELKVALEVSADSTQTVVLDQQAYGRVSRVDALQQQSMALANKEQHQAQLRKVLAALARVETGDYGYCLDCDEDIGYSRLKARPEAAYCLKCQSQREEGSRS
ncbi:TraR/DksA family transcriptional regulator [Endozoicomonas sp. Mp262]|uniref:TraR/DksA family transcriptional regulator n=1 Tax=Endozoicomonas sp. Mp262 TaxID=2919499 RepID=UPI0021DAE7E9